MGLSKKDLGEIKQIVDEGIDSKQLINANDLREILEINNEVLAQKFEEKFATKADIGHVLSKDDFFNAVAKIMKELNDIRENNTVLVHQVSKNNDRLDKVERKLQISAS